MSSRDQRIVFTVPREMKEEFHQEARARSFNPSALLRDYLRQQLNEWRSETTPRAGQ